MRENKWTVSISFFVFSSILIFVWFLFSHLFFRARALSTFSLSVLSILIIFFCWVRSPFPFIVNEKNTDTVQLAVVASYSEIDAQHSGTPILAKQLYKRKLN